jgi:hypothetical protein
MSFPSSQKRAATDSSPLQQAGILRHVLSYVGPGHWLFLSAVCSSWMDMYAKLSTVTVLRVGEYAMYNATVLVVAKTTLPGSIFTSPARVRLAHELGMQLTAEKLQYAAGYYADVETLMAAHELGVAYTTHTLRGALAGAISTLLSLSRVQQCHPSLMRTSYPMKSGSLAVLQLLLQQGLALCGSMCTHAAEYDQLNAAGPARCRLSLELLCAV